MKKYTAVLPAIILTIYLCNEVRAKEKYLNNNELPLTGRVTASALRIRSKPGLNGEVISGILKGRRIDVIADSGIKQKISGITSNWYSVKISSDESGYAFGGYIEKAVMQENLPENLSSVMNCPKRIHNSYECAQYIEKRKLPLLHEKVSRNNYSLTIKCLNKKLVSLTDTDHREKAAVDSRYYTFAHYYKHVRQFLIFIQYWEGGSYSLINEYNCEQIEVWEAPVFSPDKKWFICSSVDMISGYMPNGIEIWEKAGKNYKKNFERKLRWGAVNPIWKGNNKIEMTRYDGSPGEYYTFTAELFYTHGKWMLVE
ncbi:MAG: SH3 domain-containing protein [Spirochaetes bacterium]|nr:SH3 domain-containing protein [Spirochaetota bacterium]